MRQMIGSGRRAKAMAQKETPEKDPAAVALAAKRMQKLSAKQRSEIARSGATARWKGHDKGAAKKSDKKTG
jgi:hypothetical protein